jgi:hypothetical protein
MLGNQVCARNEVVSQQQQKVCICQIDAHIQLASPATGAFNLQECQRQGRVLLPDILEQCGPIPEVQAINRDDFDLTMTDPLLLRESNQHLIEAQVLLQWHHNGYSGPT